MNITKENVDTLNAVLKVEISATDYQDKVAEILKDYRKKADVPGFRKGNVPIGMIKKQYGKSVMIDEINKLLQESLNKYLIDEKLDILGNPLPKIEEDFSWDTEDYCFEFDLGLAPEFEIDLNSIKKITKFNIVADEEMLDKEVKNLRSRFGKLITKEVVSKEVTIVGSFKNEEEAIDNKYTFTFESIKGKKNQKKFIGAKVGDVIELSSKDLFDDENKLVGALGLSQDKIKDLDISLTLTVEEINFTELAEINQELFDKVFGEGIVKSEKELRARIKEDAEKQFVSQSDQHLFNAISEYLIENTEFDLPAEFLKKWIAVAGENPLSPEKANEEYEKSEKGLRYQLIESKVIKDNDVKIDEKEVLETTKEFVRTQMAQYGQTNPSDEELNEIAQRVLSNGEEVKRIKDQLLSSKILTCYKENIKFKEKNVGIEKFFKEVYNK